MEPAMSMNESVTILGSIKVKMRDDGWHGNLTLPAWEGFQTCLGPYGSRSSGDPSTGQMHLRIRFFFDTVDELDEELDENDEPLPGWDQVSPALVEALRKFMEEQIPIRDMMTKKIIKYMQDYRKEVSDRLPEIKTMEELKKLIGPSTLHIFGQNADSPIYVGMELGCNWPGDGIGVVTLDGKIMEVGAAHIAFTTPDHKTEEEQKDKQSKETFRKVFRKISTDEKHVTLKMSTPLTPENLGELASIYEPHLNPKRIQLQKLLRIEAIVLAEFLHSRGSQLTSGRMQGGMAFLRDLYDGVTDIEPVMQAIAKAREKSQTKGFAPTNFYFFLELDKHYARSKKFKDSFSFSA
jgi:hypothetical protein